MEYTNFYNQKYIDICKRPQKYPVFKIEILDYSEYTIMDVTQDISLDTEGSISVKYQQGIRRTCEFSVINIDQKYLPSENSMFWYHRKFRLYTGLKDQATGDIYWFSQGVFFVQNISCEKKITHITGIDKFAAFTSDLGASVLDVDYKVSVLPEDRYSEKLSDEEIKKLQKQAPKIADVIRNILTIDKGNGYAIDPIIPIIDSRLEDEPIPYDLTVGAGGFLGDMMIELAMMLGADIYYDTNGHLNLTKGTTDFLYVGQGVQWSFSPDKSDYISYTASYDISKAINKIMVYGEGYEGVYNYAVVTNDNPKSPLRVSLVGIRQGESIETAMAYSLQKCEDYGKYYLKMKSIVQLSADIECTFLPHLDVNKVIDIYDEFYSKSVEKHIIQSITFPFNKSSMKISATNVALLPYYSSGVT